jgi:hypothetical protein
LAIERVNLTLLGEVRDVPAEELEEETSLHTGRALRRLRASVRVAAEQSESVNETFRRARDTEHALEGADGWRWVVTESSYAYQNGDRVHSHTVELREVETIEPERLELLGLVLKPTRYKEEADDRVILASALVEPDAKTDEALERAVSTHDGSYFDVVRVGVSDAPMRMRFGRCLWQKGGHGRVHLLRLVSEGRDDDETGDPLMWFEPELGHVKRKVVAAEAAIDGLLEELQTAGALSETAAANVRGRIEEAWETRRRELDESRDLDLHF